MKNRKPTLKNVTLKTLGANKGSLKLTTDVSCDLEKSFFQIIVGASVRFVSQQGSSLEF